MQKITYSLNTPSSTNHLCCHVVEDITFKNLFLNLSSICTPFSLRIKRKLRDSESLLLIQKFCQTDFTAILTLKPRQSYTASQADASKCASAVPCATHICNLRITKTINTNTIIFTAETHRFKEHISQTTIQNSNIFTTSLSVALISR